MEKKKKDKRLSEANRDALLALAYRRIEATAETNDFDAAYSAAAEAVSLKMKEMFPAKDMTVLRKYELTTNDTCIHYSLGGFGDYGQFCFREGDKRIPVRPKRSRCNSRTPILFDGNGADAISAYNRALKTHESDIAQRKSDFRALIRNSQTFNQVAAIWPDAETLRETIVGSGTALSILSDEVVARLQSDPALKEAA